MKNKVLKKNSGKWIFLGGVLLLYLILSFVSPDLAGKAVAAFFQLLWKIIPVFVFVFFLMFLSNLFLDSQKMVKFIRGGGIKGWFVSIAGGILSAGPIYMWYPLLAELRKRGLKDSFVVAFLYNRAVKIPLFPMMVYYFGLPFTVILTFYMILFSIINGVLVEKILKVK
jgi:uncharacterized membrane protein YraQ (UPF0718 family)